jgi:hypothetical protein
MATTQITMATVTATVTDFCEEEGEWWKTDGVEDEDVVAAYQAKGAGSYANSKHNLAQEDTYDLVDTGHAPDWDDTNGWKFDGNSHYLVAEGIPITQNCTGIIIFTNLTGSGDEIQHFYFGRTTSPDSFRTFEDSSSVCAVIDNKNTGFNAIITNGVIAISKDGLYMDGELKQTFSISPSSFSINADFGIATSMPVSPPLTPFYVQAFVFYNKTLTPTQIAAITDNMEAL